MQQHHKYKQKNIILLIIFILGIVGFISLIYNRPQLQNPHLFDEVSFPPTPKDLYNISMVLISYKREHLAYSLMAFVYLYVFLQAFAIPGPVFLCILSSTLFGPIPGFFLSLTCSCLGASLCYWLSQTLAKGLVLKKFPELFRKFNNMVQANKNNLFWYMLFLRFTPLIPNWFVNLGSPLVGMPYSYFLFGSMIGLMPMNMILIQTGLTLKQIETIGLSVNHIIMLFILGFLALIPTFIGKKFGKKFQSQKTNEQRELQQKSKTN